MTSPTVIRARGLALRSKGRTVFDGVTATVAEGGMLVLSGPAGAGKTALGLAIAGRLTTTSGELSVFGWSLPKGGRHVRRRVGLAGNGTVNPLDDTLTVQQHIAESAVLASPWWRSWATKTEIAEVIASANRVIDGMNAEMAGAASGHREATVLPPIRGEEYVSDLLPLPSLVLSVVLALIPGPDMIVIDDVDALRDTSDRRIAWSALCSLRTPRIPHLTIVATCQDTGELTDILEERTALYDHAVREGLSAEDPVPVPEPRSVVVVRLGEAEAALDLGDHVDQGYHAEPVEVLATIEPAERADTTVQTPGKAE